VDELVASLNDLSPGHLPGLLGLEIRTASREGMTSRLPVRRELLAPNGYLHAATVVGLADTTCGYGTRLLLPPDATGFTTIELKTNFLGTVREGVLACHAAAVHAGRTTQVWDATVTDEQSGKVLALFRCTQAVLGAR
jgi:1,4-dihydroxy-2-naphthoyl-CoA hydrolase